MAQCEILLGRRGFMAGAGLTALVTVLGASGNQAKAQVTGPAGSAELRAKAGTTRLRGPAQPATAIVGFGGTVPGPTLRIRRGEEIRARLLNDWSEPTTIHWHGMRVPNGMDGVPYLTQSPIVPGQSIDYRFVARDAGTYWYHAAQVTQFERGLSGPVIVEENEPVAVDRDVLLMLADWHLSADGSLQNARSGDMGQTVLTANGNTQTAVAVRRGERVRLRLINATAGRLLRISVPEQTAWVMAIDGQPAEPFVAHDSQVMIAPGNRVDLFVDIAENAKATVPVVVDTGNGAGTPVARLDVSNEAAAGSSRGAPRPLPPNPLPARIDLRNALRVQAPLEIFQDAASGSTTKDGKKIPGGKAPAGPVISSWTPLDALTDRIPTPSFSVKRDRPVTLAFANPGPHASVIHVHGHAFRLLDNLDDGWKPFWLDTLLVAPQQTARIAFVADAPGKWAIIRRSLSNPTRESLAWFEVA